MIRNNMTNMEIRRENRKRIFRYICKQSVTSNPEIAYECKLSLPTVTQNTKELIEMGLVGESGELASTGGRKAKALTVRADHRYAVGLEITRNHIGLILCDLSGAMLRFQRLSYVFENTDEYYRGANERMESFLDLCGVERDRILGVGIVIPGIVDRDCQMITDSYTLRMRNIPFERIGRFFDYPCSFLNDANAGAYAERIRSGGESHFFYLSLSNTVGGALYTDEALVYGDHYRCGEVGHMTLVPDGEQCYCGKSGCLDSYCSAKRLADVVGGELEEYFRRLEQGDEVCAAAWDTYVKYLSVAVNNLHMIIDCDIMLGGYVGSYLGPYLEEIREKVVERNTFGGVPDYVKPSTYKVEAAAMGAALYIREAFVEQL